MTFPTSMDRDIPTDFPDLSATPELPEGDLWVFGYGSVMWRPGFPFIESRRARLYGHHRSLCVWSWHHRGSRDLPGLVLGLDRGGSCIGQAFRVPAAEKQAVAEYLYAREMVTPVYLPTLHPVETDDGTAVALTFRVDRGHAQYAGRLDVPRALATVRTARGVSGANPEYVLNTVAHMREMGLFDDLLFALARELEG